MKLQEAIHSITELRGKRLSKHERWKLSRIWRKGLNSASVQFNAISVNYGGFDGCVTVDGKRELYIGIPGAFRAWLRADGTYVIDIPNEKAVQNETYKE